MTRQTISYRTGYIHVADDTITISHVNLGFRPKRLTFKSLELAIRRIRDIENLAAFLRGWAFNDTTNQVMYSSKHRLYFILFRGVPQTPFFTHKQSAIAYLENKMYLG